MHTSSPPLSNMNESDKYCEAESPITWVRDAAVKVRYGKSVMESMNSVTVMSLVKSTIRKHPNARALGIIFHFICILILAYKENGAYQYWTYKQYYQQILATAKSFIKLGLEPFNGVGILGFNSKEWFLSNLGAIFAGGLSVGVYATNTPDAVAYVLESSQSNVCVVENDAQLQKVLKVWDQLPHLKAVVQYVGKPSTEKENVYSWEEFIKLGSEVPDEELQQRMEAQYVNKCCALIYTSGTTGNPKGVMLSHDNLTFACRVIGQFVKVGTACETIVSYLPLSHIAAQMLDIYLPISYAATVYFAQPDAFKGSLNTTLKEVSPTIFFGVPRVFEKMSEKIKIGLNELGSLKKKLVGWARGKCRQAAENMKVGQGPPFAHGIALKILGTIRVNLGLTNCRYLYAGAAPLTPETHEFFASLGLPVMEVYGMSETTGGNSMTAWVEGNRHWKPNSAGFRMPGFSYDLLDKDEKGHGEIAMYGRHVLMGYLGEEEKTKATFDSEYRLKSGDIGYVDKDGFLFISGRIKELLITAGGENVAPVPIENEVKEALPQVSNCMLIGDKRKFLSILITLKTEVDQETLLPKEEFTPQTIEWCKSIGSSATKVSDVLDDKDEAVKKAIHEGINKANKKSESNAKKIAKFTILATDFSVSGGELGPTMKLKRPAVIAKYSDVIEKMYED
ncbi:ACSBG1 [Bugula neritina]|uniref:long-chain-fatty-acid--CoA ligase n=1 Tax=Bugula neritina TaxID=10212 RepID=A0A7J7JHP3_BUGNE|nr:ACSBG1 [Bugula neritina]